MKITISDSFEEEAKKYAIISKSFTSDRHDFHEGGLNAKQRKMFEGKLGEKAIKHFLIENNIRFEEDKSSFDEADFYDFLVYDLNGNELKIDVKTRTQNFHTRTLEMVEQIEKKPKDIYLSVRLYDTTPFTVDIIGYALRSDFLNINRIQNNSFLDNYVLYDNELKDVNLLLTKLQKNG